MSEQAVATFLNSRQAKQQETMNNGIPAVLTELRQQGHLCDVVIKVADIEFKAHKIILCGCSEYFRTLFTGVWATPEKAMHTINGVSPEMMQLIIDYAYTHTIPLTTENLVEALVAADQFLIPGIVQACCKFLENQLCVKNCISIWRLMDLYNCHELRNKVFLYILTHFEEVVSVSEEFKELSVQQLIVIIENDLLNVKQEGTVFEAILCWINRLPEQRQSYISVLLPKVRLGLMTHDYLQNNVMENALIKHNNKCIRIFNDGVIAFEEFRSLRRSETIYRNLLSRPRLPHDILLATGSNDAAAFSLDAYDSRAERWVTVSSLGFYVAHHGTAVLDNFVYLIGGSDQNNCLDTVLKLDLLSHTWHHVAPMSCVRSHVSTAVLNGCIYAMGGCCRLAHHRSVERYSPETNQWNMVASMSARRSGASATTLNGKIYICGGFNGIQSINTAEFYNPDTNNWTLISCMTYCRSGLGVAAYKGRIYAVGGTKTGYKTFKTAEAYNPQTNMWHTVASMHSPRSDCGIVVMDDQIFVVGGHNGSSIMLTVECYNNDVDMWYRAAPLETSLTGRSCCVLRGLHSLAEALFPRGPLMSPNAEVAGGGTI